MSDLMSGRSPWLWLGSALAMIVAILFGIFDDDDRLGDFEGFVGSPGFEDGRRGSIDSDLQRAIDDIVSDALDGDLDLDDYTPPDVGSVAAQILVADRFGGLAATFSVQDMLDGNGFGVTTVDLAVEGRERTGVLLGGLMEKAGIEDWNRISIVGAFGDSIDVERESFDSQPDQFLLYWSSDSDPSPTVTIADPSGSGRVIDVTNITVIN